MSIKNWFDISASRNPMRKLGVLVVVFVFGPIILFLLFRLLNNGRVALTINTTSSSTVRIVEQASGKIISEESGVVNRFDKILPRGRYEVHIVTEDKRSTSYFINVSGLLKTTAVGVDLVNQNGRDKLGRDVSDCTVYSAGQLYSYACGYANSISLHTGLTSTAYSKRVEYPVSGIVDAIAYRDGVLVLRLLGDNNTAPTLSFLRNGQVVSSRVLPDNFRPGAGDNNFYDLFGDNANAENFAVISKSASIALAAFTGFEADPKLETYTFSGLDISDMVVAASLQNNRLLLAVGDSAEVLNSRIKADSKRSAKKQVVLREINLAAPKELIAEYKPGGVLNAVAYCGEARICMLQDDQLRVFKIKDKSLELSAVINQVSGLVPGPGNGVYYAQNNGIYNLDVSNLTAKLVFEASTEIYSLVSFTPTGNNLLVNALSTNSADRKLISSFLVGDAPASSNKFLDQYLPYSDISTLWDVDYRGQTILATLLLNSVALDRSTSSVVYDQVEYDQAIKQFTDKLKADGLNPAEYSINYIVSN